MSLVIEFVEGVEPLNTITMKPKLLVCGWYGCGPPILSCCDGVVGFRVGMASASSTGDVACMTNSRKSVVCRYSTTTHFPIELSVQNDDNDDVPSVSPYADA